MNKVPDPANIRSAACAATLIAGERMRWAKAMTAAEAQTGIRPSEALVAREIRRWCAVFDDEHHRAVLLRKRRAALSVMTALDEWHPVLTGHVLSGAATEDTAVEIAVRTDNEKEVELSLLRLHVNYEILDADTKDRRGTVRLLTECRAEPIILIVGPCPALMKAADPDEWQHPLEARGRADKTDLHKLLEETA